MATRLGEAFVEITAKDDKLKSGLSDCQQRVNSAVTGMQSDLNAVTKSTDVFGGALSRIPGIAASMGIALSAAGVAQFGKAIWDAGAKMQSLELAFKSITGTTAGAAAELNFLRTTSKSLGLDLEAAASGYKSISAAAMGTSMEGKGARDVFLAVSEASAALGLTADEAKGALIALGQMLSKGKVQAEELRGQLGERLPGAFGIAARAMGVTTAQLDDMLKKGEVIATDFLPRFAAELHKTFGEDALSAAGTFQGATNQMTTAWLDLRAALADTSGFETSKTAVIGLASTMEWAAGVIRKNKDALTLSNLISATGGLGNPLLAAVGAVGKFQNQTVPITPESMFANVKTRGKVSSWDPFGGIRGAGVVSVLPEVAKAARGGGGGAQPLGFEDLLPRLDAFRIKVMDSYKDLQDANYDLWISMAKDAGDFYRAGSLEVDKFAADTRTTIDKQVMEAQKAYDQLLKTTGNARGGLTPEATALMAEAEQNLARVKEVAAQRYLVLAEQEAQKRRELIKITKEQAATTAELNLEYMTLTGTTKQVAEATIAKMEADRQAAIIGKDQVQQDLINRISYQKQYLEQLKVTGTELDGFRTAAADYFRTMGTEYQKGREMFDMMKDGISRAADALAEFTLTGKMNFTDFANSIVKDILKMIYYQQLMSMFKGSGLFGGGSGGGIGSWFSGLFGGGSAFSGSVATASAFASGGWITEPVFGVGKSGRTYTFAERGAEYVSPKGKAGSVSVVNHFVIQGNPTRESQTQIAASVGNSVQRAMRRNN